MQADQVATHRAISLWGGRGARYLLRLQFPGVLVDDRTLDMAYTEEGAARVQAMGFNWVYLMASWGFPSDVETMDWNVFRRAVQLYHARGIQVCGGVQIGSAIRQGMYRDKDWYAHDAWGKPIPLHRGRYLTCLNAEAWVESVRERLRLIVEAGADGVLLAGIKDVATCYDERCQQDYGGRMPLHPRDTQLMQWKAALIRQRLDGWARDVREIKADALVVVETDDPALGGAADWVLVGGLLPSAETHNAATWAIRRIEMGDRPMLGHAGAPPTLQETAETDHRPVKAMAEAAALGLIPMVQGAGYVQRRSPTLLLHKAFESQRAAIATMNGWLEEQAASLSESEDAGPLAICATAISPLFREVCETIIQHGLPFRVVGEGDPGGNPWPGVKTLIVLPGGDLDEALSQFAARGGRVIAIQQPRLDQTPLWKGYRPGRSGIGDALWYGPGVRRLTLWAGMTGRRWYYERALVRFIVRRVWRGRTPKSAATPPDVMAELVEAIGSDFTPRVVGRDEAAVPILFTIRRHGAERVQWHLVNYHETPERVTLHLPHFVQAEILAPGSAAATIWGTEWMLTVDHYKVLRLVEERAGHSIQPRRPAVKH